MVGTFRISRASRCGVAVAVCAAALTPVAGAGVALAADEARTPRVLAFNAALMAGGNWGQDQRAELIAKAPFLKDSGADVLVLGDMTDNGPRDKLLDLLKEDYPHRTPVLGSAESEGWDAHGGDYQDADDDGGLVVLSKHPILYKKQFVYDEACGNGTGLNRGMVYAKIDFPGGKPLHVAGSANQQSGEGCPGSSLSYMESQYAELDAQIDEMKIPEDEQVIVAGDLGANRHAEDEYRLMLDKLELAEPEKFTGAPYQQDVDYNDLADGWHFMDENTSTSYVLQRAKNKQVKGWQNCTLVTRAPEWSVSNWWDTWTYHNYSHQYPVLGGAL